MENRTFALRASDGAVIEGVRWTNPLKQPRAIIQIAHGMAEHIDRYDEFSCELVAHDMFVYGNNHRGHGKTVKTEDIGYFADENGFECVVDDLYVVTQYIEQQYPGVPIFLFGHSMGSLLARRYVQLYGKKLCGLILSGTGNNPLFVLKMGRAVAKIETIRKGKRAKSPLLNSLSFGGFNRAFRPNRTRFDWLSRDEQRVDAYIQDPSCGFICTAGFFSDLLTGCEVIQRPENISLIPKELPIFLLSGDQDPVGGPVKGVRHVEGAFRKAGITEVTCKLYKDGRHEMLHETNRIEVYNDIINWVNNHR